MALQFFVYEGKQYKVGSVKFTGNKIFDDAAIRAGLQFVHDFQHSKAKLGPNNLPMDVGDTFTPGGLSTNLTALEDFYGSKGYIDVQRGQTLRAIRIPNVDTGTMDLEFQIDEGQKSYVEQIEHPRQHQDEGQGHPPRTGHCAGRSLRHGARQNQQAAPRRAGLF